MPSRDTSCVVTGILQRGLDLDLKGLPEGTSGHLVQRTVPERIDVCFRLVDALLVEVGDLQLGLLGDILVIDTRAESVVRSLQRIVRIGGTQADLETC